MKYGVMNTKFLDLQKGDIIKFEDKVKTDVTLVYCRSVPRGIIHMSTKLKDEFNRITEIADSKLLRLILDNFEDDNDV